MFTVITLYYSNPRLFLLLTSSSSRQYTISSIYSAFLEGRNPLEFSRQYGNSGVPRDFSTEVFRRTYRDISPAKFKLTFGSDFSHKFKTTLSVSLS